jgi:NH3-dependent NAD+ synthetase
MREHHTRAVKEAVDLGAKEVVGTSHGSDSSTVAAVALMALRSEWPERGTYHDSATLRRQRIQSECVSAVALERAAEKDRTFVRKLRLRSVQLEANGQPLAPAAAEAPRVQSERNRLSPRVEAAGRRQVARARKLHDSSTNQQQRGEQAAAKKSPEQKPKRMAGKGKR